MNHPDKALTPGERLNERLEQPDILLMMGTHDVLSARIIEAAGFEAIVMGGFSISGSQLGMPDIGWLTFNEALTWLTNICRLTDLPVLADADNGYGGVTNIMRTVEAYEHAGAAGIIIEDQLWPKRCGHMDGKQVISKNAMLEKINAAVNTRKTMLVCARTDAMAVNGFDEALDRAIAYAEAGADIVFFEAVETTEQMKTINEKVSAFTQINLVDHGKTPILPAEQLEAIGYDIITIPVALSFMYAKVAMEFCKKVRSDGGTHNLQDAMLTFNEYNSLLGLQGIRSLESTYSGPR